MVERELNGPRTMTWPSMIGRTDQHNGQVDSPASRLPSRLQRLSGLPWYECWVQQLRTEKKSTHTIRAYTVAAKTFSTTCLPGEGDRNWSEMQSISVEEFHSIADPSGGRMDAWMNSLGELRPSSLNARLAAISLLLR